MIKRLKKGSNVQLSAHVHSDEIDCPCDNPGCTALFYESELLDAFEEFRLVWSEPITINSGYRCPEHNSLLVSPGAATSTHIIGHALDLKIPICIDFAWACHEANEIFDFVYEYPETRTLHCDIYYRGD